METYKIIEKRYDSVSKIAYKVEFDEETEQNLIYLLDRYGNNASKGIYIGREIKETKRGWTIETSWLTSKPIKIFLPRENFYKIKL